MEKEEKINEKVNPDTPATRHSSSPIDDREGRAAAAASHSEELNRAPASGDELALPDREREPIEHISFGGH